MDLQTSSDKSCPTYTNLFPSIFLITSVFKLKASFSSIVVLEIRTVLRALQSENAKFPIFPTLPLNSTLLRFKHSENAKGPIFPTLPLNSTLSRLEQLENAKSPMSSTLPWNSTLLRFKHSENAWSPMFPTLH